MSVRAEHHLRSAAARALDAATRRGRRQWAAVRVALPRRVAPLALGEAADRFYWERPGEGRCLVAAGCAQALEAEGPKRFPQLAESARALYRDLHLAGDAAPASAGPLLVGGFGFSEDPPSSPEWADFSAARLVLPTRMRVSTPDGNWCSVSCAVNADDSAETVRTRLGEELALCLDERSAAPVDPDSQIGEYHARSERSHADYEQRVEAALEEIAAGEIEKVVVARSLRLRQPRSWHLAPLLEALRGAHPSCTIFALGRNEANFLGASPELLVRLAGRRLESAALAGSAPRGRSPEEDDRLGRELLESKKDQAEHAVVVRALRESLERCCDELEIPEAPRLRKLEGIHHLETPVEGQLDEPRHVLEVAGSLHPTAAVAGAPRASALRWLRDHEGLERGWYAGAVGVVDAQGDGEFCTALRSALLRGGEAKLFAGAGIVAGSKPEAELRETRLKLRALLDLLLEL